MEPGVQEITAAWGVIMILVVVIGVLLATAVQILIFCMIFHKAGYSWALGLLMLVPIANIIMPFILAFGDWPIRRELEHLRQQRYNAAP